MPSRSAGTFFLQIKRATDTLPAFPSPAFAMASVTAGSRLYVGFEGVGGGGGGG